MKRPRAVAVILAAALTMGEFGSTGLVVSAAGNDDSTEAPVVQVEVAEAESDEVQIVEEIVEEESEPEILGECYTISGTTLTLKGNVNKSEISSLSEKSTITKVVALEGTVLPEDSSGLFSHFDNCEEIDLTNVDTSHVTDMSSLFSFDEKLEKVVLSSFDTKAVTSMRNMFDMCIALTQIDVSSFDTRNVEDMSFMFSTCSSLTELDVSNFDTSKVTGMSHMFGSCELIKELDLSNFNTSNVTDMRYMFGNMKVLETLNVSSFDTHNVEIMESMFMLDQSLKSIDLSNFDTSNVTDMGSMFERSGLETLDLSSFNTAKVTNMNFMFDRMGNLRTLDLSNFDTGNLTEYREIFHGADNLETLTLGKRFETVNAEMGLRNGGWTRGETDPECICAYDVTEIINSEKSTYHKILYLRGVLERTGDSKYGSTATVSFTSHNTVEDVVYQWYRGSDMIPIEGATNASYTIGKDDIYEYIYCVASGGKPWIRETVSTSFYVDKADGPDAPNGLKAIAPSKLGEKDGQITGVNSTMEYSYNGQPYMDCTGTVISGLKAGTYEVRVKENDTTYAGAVAEVIIPEGDEEINLTGTVKITGNLKYNQTLTAQVSGSNASNFKYQWKRGNTAISGATKSTYKLTKDDVGQIISCVVMDADGKISNSISGKTPEKISKADGPAAPTGLTGVATSERGASDGKITGVKTTMEYSDSVDFSSNVKTCPSGTITGLKEGIYYVRVKATATTMESEATKVEVKAGIGTTVVGTVSISGNPKYNQILTAKVTDTNLTGMKYQWKRDGVAISGATSSTYKTVQEDIGKTISCVITDATGKLKGSITGKTTSKIGKLTGEDAPVGLTPVRPSVKGAADGKITGVTKAMEYATKTDFSDAKACTSTTIKGLKAGIYYVRVKETDIRNAGDYTKVTVQEGSDAAPISGKVTIDGTLKFGQTLTVKVTNCNTTKYKYQWKRGTTAISGATASTYKLVKADIGQTITCVVTSTDDRISGSLSAKTSAKITKADGPEAPNGLEGKAPSKKGKADGQITGVTKAMEYAAKTDFSDAKACTSTAITGLKAGTYYVRVKETATTFAGTSAKVVVPATADEKVNISGTVTISGTLKYNKTLTAKVSGSNASSFKYQWKRGTTAISGATAATYKLVKADIGQTITCVVTDANGKLTGSLSAKTASKITKADGPAAPTNLSATAPTKKGVADGKITGVKSTMEYATKADFSNAKTCTSTSITGLKAGNYYVRVKETETAFAGKAATVKVPQGADVNPTPTPTPTPSKDDVTKAFKDVKTGEWYVAAVQFVYDNGIMNGTSDNTFSPLMVLTRGQFVTVLYNMEGRPDATYDASVFKDVKEKDYFALPVIWAAANDITSGTGDGQFSPNKNITREQLAVMLYKYAKNKGYKTKYDKTALDSFPDKTSVSSWATEAMQWAVSNKVLGGKTGKNGNILDPSGQATRAECAQMIKNLCDNVVQ